MYSCLYSPIHLAALNGDASALRRQLVVFNVCKRNINILSHEPNDDDVPQQQVRQIMCSVT